MIYENKSSVDPLLERFYQYYLTIIIIALTLSYGSDGLKWVEENVLRENIKTYAFKLSETPDENLLAPESQLFNYFIKFFPQTISTLRDIESRNISSEVNAQVTELIREFREFEDNVNTIVDLDYYYSLLEEDKEFIQNTKNQMSEIVEGLKGILEETSKDGTKNFITHSSQIIMLVYIAREFLTFSKNLFNYRPPMDVKSSVKKSEEL